LYEEVWWAAMGFAGLGADGLLVGCSPGKVQVSFSFFSFLFFFSVFLFYFTFCF
jgi:hypothetical protein